MWYIKVTKKQQKIVVIMSEGKTSKNPMKPHHKQDQQRKKKCSVKLTEQPAIKKKNWNGKKGKRLK